MCGFVGVAANAGRSLSVSDSKLAWMRDMLTHRGVDDAGLWRHGHVAFGHRRLAIVDAAHAGQPWVLGEGGSIKSLSYNGQLYNWRALREELKLQGVSFVTNSDTEVVAQALAKWGKDAFAKFRGMYAIAWYDAQNEQLLLARDQLGIKPLYYAKANTPQGEELVFGSEPMGVLAHPGLSAQPDWLTVSAYLSTIRTTLGNRTLFDGLSTMLPGELQIWNLRGKALSMSTEIIPLPELEVASNYEDAVIQLRSLVEESVSMHLMGDMHPAGFLSGGLDSSIITKLASGAITDFHTFAATTPSEQRNDGDYAELLAAELGLKHARLDMSPQVFQESWGWMIQRLGVPLSTPNEVAIYHIADAASHHSKVVLSGEGADELFAGYGAPLNCFANYLNTHQYPTVEGMTSVYLNSMAWVSPQFKGQLLNPSVQASIDGDQCLHECVAQAFAPKCGERLSLRNVLNAQRQLNLTGQLRRLDTATMLANIEGRTPLADAKLASFAAQMPMEYLFQAGEDPRMTKRVLRDAFAPVLPQDITARPKASFPLPFQQWLAQQSSWLTQMPVAREVFQPHLLQAVAQDPNQHWMSAWPLMNLAYWLEWHWGSAEVRQAA